MAVQAQAVPMADADTVAELARQSRDLAANQAPQMALKTPASKPS